MISNDYLSFSSIEVIRYFWSPRLEDVKIWSTKTAPNQFLTFFYKCLREVLVCCGFLVNISILFKIPNPLLRASSCCAAKSMLNLAILNIITLINSFRMFWESKNILLAKFYTALHGMLESYVRIFALLQSCCSIY